MSFSSSAARGVELEQAKAEREKALESLTASEERCAMLLRGASEGLWEWILKRNEMHFLLTVGKAMLATRRVS